MLKSITSILLFFALYVGYAQDSIPKYTERYSIRFGIDLSKPIRSLVEDRYKGLELTADYRLAHKFFLAAEVGMEEKRVVSESLDFQTSGEYLKLGFDIRECCIRHGLFQFVLRHIRIASDALIGPAGCRAASRFTV